MAAINNWFEDILQQFHGRKNIEVFIRAFAKQFDELYQVYEDLMYETTLERAVGQNLKYIGDILSTSEKEAHEILKDSNISEITDETYRKVLMYKALADNCDCTYYDIMESISLLWDVSKVSYDENTDKPATVYLNLQDANVDGVDPSLGRVLAIRPAGVEMIYAFGYITGVNISGIETANVPAIIVTTPWKDEGKVDVSDIEFKYQNKNEEKVTASCISTRDTWYLDGTYMLDGSKLLNANEIIEEVL